MEQWPWVSRISARYLSIKQRHWFIRLGAVGVAILAGSSITYLVLAPHLKSSTPTSSESRSESRSRIVALGRLEPDDTIVNVAGPTGERVGKILVKEGEWVKSGQVLAYLESYAVQRSRRDLAASRVVEIADQIKRESTVAQVQIEQSQAQVRQVDMPQLLATQSQEARVRGARAELANATRARDRFKLLLQKGAVSQQDYDDKELILQQARENLSQAEKTLKQLHQAHKTNLSKAEKDLRFSQANLERVQQLTRLESAKKELSLAKAELDRTIIRAPRPGKVLKIFAYPGEAIAQQGILNLADTRTMYAVAEVYETDVRFLQVGDKARISSPAFAAPLSGEVAEIGQFVFKNNILSDDPASRSDVRVIEVKVRLNHPEKVASFSQLQVDVDIDLNSPTQE